MYDEFIAYLLSEGIDIVNHRNSLTRDEAYSRFCQWFLEVYPTNSPPPRSQFIAHLRL